MYDIRQFKPAMYLLLLLGISGFALAAQSPVLWVLGGGALLLNAYLVWRGKFKPVPRIASNLITIAALLYVTHEVLTSTVTTVLSIGQFLVLLQIVKVWEQRGNRDYAQLLVLSLLLVVAASINTASMIFGVLLVVYLFLSLYTCLLFHLKVETDAAKAAIGIAPQKLSPATLRQDQRHLTTSMRKLTVLVSMVAIAFAVAVFVLFPRGTGAGILGPLQMRGSQALVGFNDEVNFQNIARIQQNNAVVAHVGVTHNDAPVTGGESLLLRGLTYDHYTGSGHEGFGAWRWTRTETGQDRSEMRGEHDITILLDSQADQTDDRWVQHVNLLSTGSNALFAMGGPISLRPRRPIKVRFSKHDGVIQAMDLSPEPLEYEVVSSNVVGSTPPTFGSGTSPSSIDPKIRQYARLPDVSGTNEKGLLADQRHKDAFNRPVAVDELDEQIARNIERHLKTQFAYTLDLTDTRRIEGRDPLVAFLYDFKKGHCEYFAGAMTLMCQSLGMTARMVAGFNCDEYNATPGADYYIVRQSHAHAWVEVLTPHGWKTFDPTSERDAAEQARRAGMWQRMRHLLDFLEYTYANAVIAYSNEDRDNLIQTTETAMLKATIRSSSHLDQLRRFRLSQWQNSPAFWKLSSWLVLVLVAAPMAIALTVIGRFFWDKWRLRRRAVRIGIGSLPAGEQLRLARQLGFYDDLLRLLGRHQIARPRHLTPMEFSRSLLFLPSDSYETVHRLTELFYRVRYGRAELSPTRRRRLDKVIERLETDLDAVKS